MSLHNLLSVLLPNPYILSVYITLSDFFILVSVAILVVLFDPVIGVIHCLIH